MNRRAALASAWLLAIGAVVVVRFRGQWPWYVEVHRWLARAGTPDLVRNLDSFLIYIIAAVLGASIAAPGPPRRILATLGLRRGIEGWLQASLIALAPMIVGGLTLGLFYGNASLISPDLLRRVFRGVVIAPIQEELLFRGLLVGVLSAQFGWQGRAFRVNVLAAAALFASVHVEWGPGALSGSWTTLMVTGLGGIWYAWLFARWRALWVPLVLHAGMNLGWLLAGATGGAGGGGWIENGLRVATIAMATALTIRNTRSRLFPEGDRADDQIVVNQAAAG